jgi:hypothetical protein
LAAGIDHLHNGYTTALTRTHFNGGWIWRVVVLAAAVYCLARGPWRVIHDSSDFLTVYIASLNRNLLFRHRPDGECIAPEADCEAKRTFAPKKPAFAEEKPQLPRGFFLKKNSHCTPSGGSTESREMP